MENEIKFGIVGEKLNLEMLCLLMNHEQHKEESWIKDYEAVIKQVEGMK